MKVTKKAIKEFLKLKLATNPNWACAAVLRIYEHQTTSEKATQDTHEDNGVGFSGCDAEILSSFAEQLLKGRILSAKQMNIVFKKMPKYWNQISQLSNQEKLTNQVGNHLTIA